MTSTNASTLDSKLWNDFVAASPFGDAMQCLEWGEVKRGDWQPIPFAVQNGDKFDATALVLKRKLPLGRSILYVPRGPILDWNDHEAAQKIVRKLRHAARAHRAILIKIDPAVPSSTRCGDQSIDETIRALGFVPSADATSGFGGTQPRCVMKLDIAGSEDEVQARFHAKWRYNIRVAKKKGVTVKSDCTREDIAIFHQLYATTAQRDGFTGRPLSYFEKMLDVLEPKGLAKLFLTLYDGVALSGAICFLLPPQCWYVYGASSNEHRNVMPNHAMQWAMMRWARENSCTIYDFRGVADEAKTSVAKASETTTSEAKNSAPDATSSTRCDEDAKKSDEKASDKSADHLLGLNRFKAGFGAELVDYVGEYDMVLDPRFYWLWTNFKPKVVALLKRRKSPAAHRNRQGKSLPVAP